MNLKLIKEKFKPTFKKLIWSLGIALVLDVLYWLVIENTKMIDVIEPIMEWYKYSIVLKILSAPGIALFFIVAVFLYIILSLKTKE